MAYAAPSATVTAKVTATITGAVGSVFATTLAAAPAATRVAAASILDPSHPDPTVFDVSNPIVMFILQATIIVGLSRLLAYFLAKMRQPRVIAEVVGGIILGPSIMGRVPHFTAHIFPPISLSYLNLVATIGLIFFLFLVGLEVDFSLFRRNMKASSGISFVGMIIPFALGAAISVGIYNKFVDESKVKFGTFLLFIGTANAITAFPVLARILTELDMLGNHVGVIVLSAGVGNDVVGWVLLALAIALVNASSGLIVLYVILTSIAWLLVLWFIMRPLLVIACRRSGSSAEKGPSQGIVCGILFLVLISAWITDRIGIHAIFGGFIVGLIVPHEIRGGIVEKIEDLVSCLFLPLYFALSGLRTDLGLLNNGSIWGYTVAVIVVAFFGKFLSCGLAAKAVGMDWRESGAVGSLMACKGLVELIVLNIGLTAGILNSEVFAMFVTMALVTTFATTPLTLLFYPLSYRIEKERASKGLGGVETIVAPRGESTSLASRFTVILESYETLPAIFAFVKLIAPQRNSSSKRPDSTASYDEKSDGSELGASSSVSTSPQIDALRLIELSQRTSSLVQASETQESLIAADSLTQIFKSFSLGSGITTSTSLAIASHDSYGTYVATHAESFSSEIIVLPWNLASSKGEEGVASSLLPNPFEAVFGRGRSGSSSDGSPQYASFVRRVFAEASCDVGLFLHRGTDSTSSAPHSGRTRLFFAFHGGSDDRNALDFIVHLAAANPSVSATIVRMVASDASDDSKSETREGSSSDHAESPVLMSQLTVSVSGGGNAIDTIYPTQNRLSSDTADNLALARWFGTSPQLTAQQSAGVGRINFSTMNTSQPLHLSVARARALGSSSASPLIIVVGRGRRDAPSYHAESTQFLKTNLEATKSSIAGSSEVRRSLGELGTAYLVAGVGNAVLVLQSATVGAKQV